MKEFVLSGIVAILRATLSLLLLASRRPCGIILPNRALLSKPIILGLAPE
jgi:hypothetical protein